jgi:hypothetical protein
VSPRTRACLEVGFRIVALERLARLSAIDCPCVACGANARDYCRGTDGQIKATCKGRSRFGRKEALRSERAFLKKLMEEPAPTRIRWSAPPVIVVSSFKQRPIR